MARVTVDFGDIEEFEPLPNGDYEALIEKLEYRESQEEGKYPYISWEIKVTEAGEFANRLLWLNTSLSPKALFRLKDILEALGLYEDELEIDYDEESKLVTSPEVAGMPCMVTTKQRPYEGRVQNDVVAVTSIDGGAKKTTKKTTTKSPAAKKPTSRTRAASGRKFK